jgi:3-hydroxyisobutyrate dehydrogenase-like beta-hydroxyacid dehydrogenase
MSQQFPTVAIVSPGDMGHVVGQVLVNHGLRVITALAGRSTRTQTLAAKAGIVDVDDYPALVREADLLLSILVPAEALATAHRLAEALMATGRTLLFVDCNAIAPETVRQIEAVITAAGSRCVDASIIGPPPRKPGSTRIYASGVHAAEFARLCDFGLEIPVLGPTVGQASAFKMCYAALTKGFTALCTELLTAAEALQITEPLTAEFQQSQPLFYEQMRKGLPGMPPKARRWVGEMEEIAATFAHLGLTPQILAGAAEMYRLVGATPLADRTPEDPTPPPTLAEMISVLAASLSSQRQS